ADGQQCHRDEHDPIVLDRKDTGIHFGPPPRASPRSRTLIPSRRNPIPATTIRSPGDSPSRTSTRVPLAAPNVTGRGDTLLPESSTHATCSPEGILSTDVTGTRIRSPRTLARRYASVTVAVMPGRMRTFSGASIATRTLNVWVVGSA